MDVLILVGRILFVLVFVSSGLMGHFGQVDQLTAWSESRGLKNARLMVLASGAWIVVGGLMVAFGVFADLGFLLLAAFSFGAAFLMHGFWKESDPMQKMSEQTQFMKNLALAGAALVMFVFFAAAGSTIGLQITDPLFEVTL